MLPGGSLEGDLQIPEAGAGWAVLQGGLHTPAARVSVNARGLLDCCLGAGMGMASVPCGLAQNPGKLHSPHKYSGPPVGCGLERDCKGPGPRWQLLQWEGSSSLRPGLCKLGFLEKTSFQNWLIGVFFYIQFKAKAV